MNILIVDDDGVGLSYALRAAQAGHQVRWFVQPKPANDKTVGEGFKGVQKVDNWVSHAKWADLIFPTTNTRFMPKLDAMKKMGMPIFGPSLESAKLEIDRAAGMKFFEKHGIECVPYETFPNMAAAEKHVWKTGDRYVFKTMGDNEDKALTYVSKSPADMIEWMRRTPPPKGEVMLQTFVEGIELGVSRYIGSKGFVGQWNESREHKKTMSGEFGPNCGEAGTVAWFTDDSKIGKETLAKMEEDLVKMGHAGDVAIGFMIDDKGKPWPTEFTMRAGWPCSNLFLGSTKGDPMQWMKDALEGNDTTSFSEAIGCCIVMAAGAWPNETEDRTRVMGLPIYGTTKTNTKHLHPQAVRLEKGVDMDGETLVERPMWKTAGDYVMVVTGFGKDVKQACERAYKTVKQIKFSNPIVRDDVGECLEEELPKLHALGYATHADYVAGKG